MINPFHEINWQPDRKAIADFGRTLVIGGVIGSVVFTLAAIGFGSQKLNVLRNVFAVIAVVGVPAWTLPGAWAKPIYLAWFFLAACIGIVVANLTLMIFYYLFFTIIALALRLTGRDPLVLRKPPQDSNWQDSPPPPPRRRYSRQY